MIAAAGYFVSLPSLFAPPETAWRMSKRRNGLNIKPGSDGPGGQNNIKTNPVFRGMVRW